MTYSPNEANAASRTRGRLRQERSAALPSHGGGDSLPRHCYVPSSERFAGSCREHEPFLSGSAQTTHATAGLGFRIYRESSWIRDAADEVWMPQPLSLRKRRLYAVGGLLRPAVRVGRPRPELV